MFFFLTSHKFFKMYIASFGFRVSIRFTLKKKSPISYIDHKLQNHPTFTVLSIESMLTRSQRFDSHNIT